MPLTVAAALIAEAVPRTTALAPLIAAALAPVASPLRVRATKCAPASPAAMTTAPGTGGAIAVDLAIANWQGAIGPPKLNAAQIAYWDGVFARTVRTDEWRADQEQNLWESDYLNAAEFSRFLKADYEQAKAVFGELGLVK